MMKSLLLFILIFIVTLVFDIPNGSFVLNFAYNLSILCFAFIYFTIFVKDKSVNLKHVYTFFILISFFTIYSFIDVKQSLTFLLLVIVNYLLGFLIFKIGKDDYERLLRIINYVIYLHVSILVFQYLLVNFMKVQVNFHEILFPFSSGKVYQLKGMEYTRITGLFNEPGTYSTWVAILSSLSVLLSSKIKPIHIFSFLSILITFSATAFFFLGVFIVLIFYKKIKNFSIKNIAYLSLVVLTSLVVLYKSGVYDYILWRFMDDSVVDSTSDLKFEAINHLLNSSFIRQFFGSGLGVNDCASCLSLQDVGLLFNYFFYFGFLSIIPILLLLSNIKRFNAFIFFALILLFSSKVFLFSSIFWVAIFIVFLVSSRSEKEYV